MSHSRKLTHNRHHVFVKNTHKDIQLAEVGPRFEAKRELPFEFADVSV